MAETVAERITVTDLSEFEEDKTPPCEFYRQGAECGRPSETRMYVECPKDGASGTAFYCGECATAIKTEVLACPGLHMTRYRWREM